MYQRLEKKRPRDISSSGQPAELKAMDVEAGTLCARTQTPMQIVINI